MSLLHVQNLSFSYGEHSVLREISFDLERGDLLSVLGPNGVGKSTLFRCILGLLQDYSGSIESQGKELRSMSRRELSCRIAYIPQLHSPAFSYSVLDSVLMGTTRQLSAFSQPKKAQVLQAMEALERVGAAHLAHRDFSRISGGEQQLALIARAIAQQADILIMDEPTSALDYGNQLRILALVRELAREGYAVLISMHNPQHALTFATRILALMDGQVAALGAPEAELTPELIDRLYSVDAVFADTPGGRVIVPFIGAPTQGK